MTETTLGYRELSVWQKAMRLVSAVYRLVKQLPAEVGTCAPAVTPRSTLCLEAGKAAAVAVSERP